MKVLLVEPEFPVPSKSRNHKSFLPIGLLKIGAYLKNDKDAELVQLTRSHEEIDFVPDEIYVTSLFTYWSHHFWESVQYYRTRFPHAKVRVGGIYVSLMFDDSSFRELCNKYAITPHRGVFEPAEGHQPDYSLISVNPQTLDYQIIHASRGCPRKCAFCGVERIEPSFKPKKSIIGEIRFPKIVFYDNNMLANPYIENILEELITLRSKRQISWCEAQSGFDVRILTEKPHLARMLRDAGFRYPRIAWDWGIGMANDIRKGIELLTKAGYGHKDIFIFMLYNWRLPYETVERKRAKCWDWKVQIADCRYRPLNQLYDSFDSRKEQSGQDYFIHPKWTDNKIKTFRRNVRQHNICVRQRLKFYSETLEKMKVSRERSMELRRMSKLEVKPRLPDAWFPDEMHFLTD